VNQRQGGFRGKWWKGTVRERWLVHEQGAGGWEESGSWTLNFEDFMWAIVLVLCDPASLVEISRRVLRLWFR